MNVPSSTSRRSLRRLIGPVLSLLGLAFVVRAFWGRWADVRASVATVDGADAPWLFVSVACAVAGMVLAAWLWRFPLRILGGHLPSGRTVALFFRGEIAKYVPGGALGVVGRSELARRDGIAADIAYASVLLSVGAMFLAGAGVAVTLLPWRTHAGGAELLVLLAVPAGALALHPRTLTLVRGVVARLARHTLDTPVPRWRTSAVIVASYAPSWLAIGTSTWAVARTLGMEPGWPETVFATAVSWIAGFVALPAPGGIGVREAAFIAMAPLPAHDAAVAAIAARLVFVAVDAVGAAVALVIAARPHSGEAGRRPSSRARDC